MPPTQESMKQLQNLINEMQQKLMESYLDAAETFSNDIYGQPVGYSSKDKKAIKGKSPNFDHINSMVEITQKS